MPRLPSVTQMIRSAPLRSDLAASRKRAVIVGVAKLALRQQTEFGFIEDQDIGEIEQWTPEFDGRRRIEDGRAPAARALFEKGGDRGQGNLELADRDIARDERCAGHVGGTHQRIGAGNDDNGVVGIGKRDDARFRCGRRMFPAQR